MFLIKLYHLGDVKNLSSYFVCYSLVVTRSVCLMSHSFPSILLFLRKSMSRIINKTSIMVFSLGHC